MGLSALPYQKSSEDFLIKISPAIYLLHLNDPTLSRTNYSPRQWEILFESI